MNPAVRASSAHPPTSGALELPASGVLEQSASGGLESSASEEPGATGLAVEALVQVIASLRSHCPWMAALTPASLVEYLVEESYELVEALETGSGADVQGELGDVLLQVVLHAQLAQEVGTFSFADVAEGLRVKMIRRNPHVFRADGSLRENFLASEPEIVAAWHRIKREERAAEGPSSPFAGIPVALPALARAQKSLDRAALTIPDGQDTPGTPVGRHDSPMQVGTEAELGDLLFDIVRMARAKGLDAERALRNAVRNFQQGSPVARPSEISEGQHPKALG